MPEQPRILRAMISGLLVVEAILVVHPMLAVSNFFVGSGVLGKALAHVPIPDVIAQGVGYLLSPLVVLLLLLAAEVTLGLLLQQAGDGMRHERSPGIA